MWNVRGKGAGKASLCKLTSYVFDELKFKKMNTMVLENNDIAFKMYGKLEGKLKRDGKEINVFLMSPSKEKWEEVKAVRDYI